MLVDTKSMVWSFSRLSAFETCPYLFYKMYVEGIEREDNFFSQYGSFVHDLLERFYNGQYETWELKSVYEEEYRKHVTKNAPPNSFVDLDSSYYDSGAQYLASFKPVSDMKILGVEKEYTCIIEEYPFKMIVDLILESKNGDIIIQDHKSKSIKSANDANIKPYWRQMSIYSIPVYEEYGRYPTELQINAFKTGKIFSRKFNTSMVQEAKEWCIDTIRKIESEESWCKKPDQFFCDFLCDLRHRCDKKANSCL
jgi:hypothetical protein